MAKLSINLVVNNSSKYLPFLLASLKQQTFKDWEIIFVDNASTDDSLAIFEKEMVNSGMVYKIIKNTENIGFAPGHNQAYAQTRAPLFLLQNADMYLAPDALEKMVKFLDNHDDTAAVSPRLMRWDFGKVIAAGGDIISAARAGFTNQIDAIGIRLFRNRRAVEWLTREEWKEDSENPNVRELYHKNVREVFGVSGALPMYRKSVTDKILLPGNNLFDPTYHSYKEDLDLAYRLRNAGFMSYVLLDTVAYHDRFGAGPKEMGDLAAIKNKTKQSYFVRYHSYKNHLRTLFKNEYWQNVILDLPFIFWYELKKFGYLLFFNPQVIVGGWIEIFKHRHDLKSARQSILSSRRMYWKGIRRWFL